MTAASLALAPIVPLRTPRELLREAKFAEMRKRNGRLFLVKNPNAFKWTRGDVIALAKADCTSCHGSGFSLALLSRPCNCVLRAIFRQCYGKWLDLMTQEKSLSHVSLCAIAEKQSGNGLGNRINRKMYLWSRKSEEYIADFELIARRTLTTEEHRLFVLHFLHNADWRLCSRQLGLSRGNFFHAVYRVEQKLGRVFRELKPYSLFPIDQYFNS